MLRDQTRCYLDYNAGAPMRASVKTAMLVAWEIGGNASSVHAQGRAARAAIESARRDVARLVNGAARSVTFTSGGSEAANTLLTPEWLFHGKPMIMHRLLISAVEHPCVLKGGRFAPEQIERIPVDAHGVVELAWLVTRLAELAQGGERALVSVMAANNETGVVQPTRAIADLVRGHGGVFVVDAVQIAGRASFDLPSLGADAVFLSAHKFGGPQGIGAIVRANDSLSFRPLVAGGGQEFYARAGTENVAGIVGFATACREAILDLENTAEMLTLRGALEQAVRITAPDAVIFGEDIERLPNTVAFAVEGIAAETAVIGFDLAGVSLSSGSACSSGKVNASHVLAAMGVAQPLAKSALRLSLGHGSTMADVEKFAATWATLYPKLCKQVRKAIA